MTALKAFILIITLYTYHQAGAQTIGIGTNAPNASAQLDVSSTTKGLLVPRMTTAQRTAIASPAKGLLVFDNDKNSFWFHNGTAWNNMTSVPAFPSAVGGQTLAYNGTQWLANDFLWNIGSQVSINEPNSYTTYRLNVVGGADNYDGIRSVGNFQGVYGTGSESGIVGFSPAGTGVVGTSTNGRGMFANSTNGTGLYASSSGGVAVDVTSTNYIALRAVSSGPMATIQVNNNGTGPALSATSNSGNAISASSSAGIAIYASSTTGNAGYFDGKTYTKSLGVGTNSPLAPLHVAGSSVVASSSAQYISYGYNGAQGLFTNLSNPTWATGLLVDYDIVTRRSLVSAQNVTASDARIKNIVSVSNNDKDLETIGKIQVTNYTYKDVANFGSTLYKKVIAQQVESVYPIAVRKRAEFIPDIYAVANIKFEEGTLSITLEKPMEINTSDELKLIDEQKGEMIAQVIKQTGPTTFIISNPDLKSSGRIFVYGTRVNDFEMVDYEALSVLNISATQALLKKMMTAEKKLEALEEKLNKLNSLLEKSASFFTLNNSQ